MSTKKSKEPAVETSWVATSLNGWIRISTSSNVTWISEPSQFYAWNAVTMPVATRGLGGSSDSPSLSDDNGQIFKLLEICAAIVSVVSAVVTFYWFLKMRRSFRHEYVLSINLDLCLLGCCIAWACSADIFP